MGSPPCEWGRGRFSETESETTLTHAFYMQEKELTIAEWGATGEPNVTLMRDAGVAQCVEASCPVAQVNWYEALRFANKYSAWKGLPECYRVEGCTSDAGTGVYGPTCANVSVIGPSVYDCTGYRLPTEAEWEYAARAGSRTATYAGSLAPTPPPASPSDCSVQNVLEPISWYCANAGGVTHPGGQKAPNAWGLFDMAGNVGEYTSDLFVGIAYAPARRVDPGGTLIDGAASPMRGGGAIGTPRGMRSANRYDIPRIGALGGLRLVRTAK
ncbi:MAG: formylglycine-generating enzyme family protein [Myxococcales bacterium]|nr:formylglycine-generating enzyme family protein [Myxococcales bacterium]